MPGTKNLKGAAYGILKQKILSNELGPGEYLEEKRLCELTGTSRTPVREAINRLAQEGLVTMIPKKGAFVTTIGIQDAKELFEARILLEPMALRRAMPNLDLDRLIQYRRDFELGLERKDYPFLHQKDYEFHNYLNACCKNSFLIRSLEHLQDMFQMVRTQEFYSKERTENGALEHLQMIDLFLQNDEDGACGLLARHIANTQKYYFQSLIE